MMLKISLNIKKWRCSLFKLLVELWLHTDLFLGYFVVKLWFLKGPSLVAVAVHANQLLFILKKQELLFASFPDCSNNFPEKFLPRSGCLFWQMCF